MSDRSSTSNETGSRRMQGLICLGIAAVYAISLVWTDGLHQSPYKDEKHNWESTQMFLDFQVPPSVEELRSYPELITPLSFMLWSQLERATGAGLFGGRLFNFILSIAIVALVGLRRRPQDKALLAAVGLLLYPYFLPLSVHLYTDITGAFLGLVGLVLYAHRWPLASAVFFALAIATRQYMLALSAAVAVWALVEQLRGRNTDVRLWLAPVCASATMFFWFSIFGGLGPPSGVDKWVPLYPAPMMEVLAFIPEYGLYFLTLVGAYFVIPEFILFRRWRDFVRPSRLRTVLVVVGLGLAFAIFPPTAYQGSMHLEPDMGALDRVVRTVAPNDAVRMVVFYALGIAACLRFRRIDVAFWILLATFAVDMKAQIAWEKYALPALVALWYLKSIHVLDGGRFPLAARRPEET